MEEFCYLVYLTKYQVSKSQAVHARWWPIVLLDFIVTLNHINMTFVHDEPEFNRDAQERPNQLTFHFKLSHNFTIFSHVFASSSLPAIHSFLIPLLPLQISCTPLDHLNPRTPHFAPVAFKIITKSNSVKT